MLFGEDPLTLEMMWGLVIEDKGKNWRVMTPPNNPDNTNFLKIIDVDLVLNRQGTPRIAYYTIDSQLRLHKRRECECAHGGDVIKVNFINLMGLDVKDITYLGENDMDLTLAPCMMDDEV